MNVNVVHVVENGVMWFTETGVLAEHVPAGVEVPVEVRRFCIASPIWLLLTHSTAALLSSCTRSVNMLLMVCFDTVLITEYSVWFVNSCHLMVGKGEPSLIHMQVRMSG